MTKKGNQSLADPAKLQPMDEDGAREVRAVIETPKGSRNKYAFEPDQRVFELKKVLPSA